MRPHNDGAADAGFTLTELLVSIVVFGIVCAMVTTASVSGLRHQTQLQNRGDALAQARAALQRIDRDIRSASYPALSVSSTNIVLQELEPTTTRVMSYTVTGGDLYVDQTDTSAAGVVTHLARKALLSDLVETTASPVFSFTAYPDYAAPVSVLVDTSTCALSSGTIDTGCVGAIAVQLIAQPPFLSQPVRLSDGGTELRNAP